MIAQRTITSTFRVENNTAAVEEAMRFLLLSGRLTAGRDAVALAAWISAEQKKTTANRWVCEQCGMIHTGTIPDACDSCGSTASLVQQDALHHEMHSRW